MLFRDFALSRRAFVSAAIAFGALPTELLARKGSSLIAGTYAGEGGSGLVPLTAGPDGWTAGRPYPAIRNASFGVTARDTGIRYLVDEQENGRVAVHDRHLRRLGAFPTLGSDPCHIALSADGSTLAVANYSSGSVTVWQLDRRTGLPKSEGQCVVHTGSGPNSDRQAGAHAHWVGFSADGAFLQTVDLGADAIFSHARDPRTGRIGDSFIGYHAVPGSGPRHLARHPKLPVAYLVAELANSVTVLHTDAGGTFSARATLSTLPAGFSGSSAAAEIALNWEGTRLYVSNRGHDSIGVFAVGGDGALELIQHVDCGGHWPRHFLLLENRCELLVANERSGNIARLPLTKDGMLGAAESGPAASGVVFLSV